MITPASKVNDVVALKTDTFLDGLTGINGLPRGRIVEFYGETNTGKTTAAYHVIAAAQKEGLQCVLVDVEHQFTPEYAEAVGVDTDTLMIVRATSAEDFIDETEALIREGKFQVVVFDSIGDLSSRVEMEKMSGEKTIGIQASLMTKFSRQIAPFVALHKILFIGINHERKDFMNAIGGKAKIFTMGGKKWSEKKKLSLRFREKPGTFLKSGENIVGKVIRVSVVKNHVGKTEGKEVEANLLHGQGFMASLDLLEDALTAGVISKEGNSYYFAGEKIGTIGKLREWIKDHSEEVKEAMK